MCYGRAWGVLGRAWGVDRGVNIEANRGVNNGVNSKQYVEGMSRAVTPYGRGVVPRTRGHGFSGYQVNCRVVNSMASSMVNSVVNSVVNSMVSITPLKP